MKSRCNRQLFDHSILHSINTAHHWYSPSTLTDCQTSSSSPSRSSSTQPEKATIINLHRWHSRKNVHSSTWHRLNQSQLRPLFNSCHSTRAHTKTVTTILPSLQTQPQTWPHLKGLKLADPEFLTPRPIDIIIGADHYTQIIKPNILRHSASAPIAQLSIFGWLILGQVQPTSITHCSAHNSTIQCDDRAAQELLTKFWVQEELPRDNSNQLTVEEWKCEEHFLATQSRDSSGRYTVRIPITSLLTGLGQSYDTAHRCLQNMLKRLSWDKTLNNLYHQPGTASYYLPYHGVLKPDSITTKLRVVFNGSSPSSTGKSINDLMHTGANLLLDISDVFIWIRHHRHI